jgi:hypothetical protein
MRYVALNLCLSGLVTAAHAFPQQQRQLPTRPDEIVRQAASAVRRALEDGMHRQTIRIPLSEVMYSDKEEGFVADRAIGWQGGPQETLRYLSPLASQLLQEIRPTKEAAGLPPRVGEQVLLDCDGSSLLTAESPSGALDDIQALLQPNTDNYYSKTIASIEEQFSDTPGKAKRLFLLVNPAWRNRDSWGFFGGQKAQTQILERYPTTYALEQFVVKNEQMSRLFVYPEEWGVFVKDAGKNDQYLGSFKDKPDYVQMEELLVRSKRGR